MLEVTPIRIEFKIYQKRYNILIRNKGQDALIFHVRSTSTSLFTVQPNAGFLRSNTELSLLITLKARHPMAQIIQITHAAISKLNLSIEQTWREISNTNSNIYEDLVYVKMPDQSEEIEEMSETRLKRERKSPMSFFNDMQKKVKENSSNQQSQTSIKRGLSFEGLSVIREDQEFKDYAITESKQVSEKPANSVVTNTKSEKKQHYDVQERERILKELEELSKRLKKEVNRSARLKQQLDISEARLRESCQQGLKIQVGQSIGILCEQRHTSFTKITLVMLVAFILGYLISRFF